MSTREAVSVLSNLQQRQLEHDKLAHADLLHQLVPKRLTHFTLHFAKYQGAICTALQDRDPKSLHRALTDSMIILLAAANALNLNLTARHAQSSIRRRGELINQSPESTSNVTLFNEYVILVGKMAKACEVLDHLEAFPSRSVLETSVLELTGVVDSFMAQEGLDVQSAVTRRWEEIEAKVVPNESNCREDPHSLPAAANH